MSQTIIEFLDKKFPGPLPPLSDAVAALATEADGFIGVLGRQRTLEGLAKLPLADDERDIKAKYADLQRVEEDRNRVLSHIDDLRKQIIENASADMPRSGDLESEIKTSQAWLENGTPRKRATTALLDSMVGPGQRISDIGRRFGQESIGAWFHRIVPTRGEQDAEQQAISAKAIADDALREIQNLLRGELPAQRKPSRIGYTPERRSLNITFELHD